MDGLDTGNIALDGHRKGGGEPGERTAVKGGARPWRPHWRASMKRHGRNSQSEALVDISPTVFVWFVCVGGRWRGGRAEISMFPSQSLESTCQDFASQCRSRVSEISPTFGSICIDREVRLCGVVGCSIV